MTALERDTLVVVIALTVIAAILSRGSAAMAFGVLGGGVLIGIAYWAIRGLVDGLADRAIRGEIRAHSRIWPLVKFFTRHAILALAGYGMMARLELDPLGLLMGASAPAIAAAVGAARERRAGRAR